MFKSITYLRHDQETNSYIYKLIDSEFECEIAAMVDTEGNWVVSPEGAAGLVLVAALAVEYKKRNLPVIRNLFRFNLFLSKKNNFSFEKILDGQNKYVDKYCKSINFSSSYYQNLKEMWDKHKVFL